MLVWFLTAGSTYPWSTHSWWRSSSTSTSSALSLACRCPRVVNIFAQIFQRSPQTTLYYMYNKRQCDQSSLNTFSTFSVSSTNTVHQRAIRSFQTGKIVNSEIRRTPETPDTCNAETYKAIHEPLEKNIMFINPAHHVQSIIFYTS